jgi:N utilization substance protein B
LTTSRISARKLALKALYIYETTGENIIEPANKLSDVKSISGDSTADMSYVKKIYDLVYKHYDEILEKLEKVIVNWEIERLAIIDKCILLIATVEMTYLDTPPKVCISEAIKLAKEFGSEKSSQFVNGVMDAYMRRLEDSLNE